MRIWKTLRSVRAGFPGGWEKYATGIDGENSPPFVQPENPDDRRSLIPAHGLPEYWYPALPDKAVGKAKPVALKLLNKRLVFFRGKDGKVAALDDSCPHRGAYLSWGNCFWHGYVSCPYHGATFDENGECVEFITEGPQSKMVGAKGMRARVFPTRTLKGVVFVWMGENAPAPIEEDVPPEFFDRESMVQTAWRYWDLNWMIALENTGDAHNMFYVHRNSFRMLRNRLGGRPRTPIGYRVEIVNNKSVKRLREGSGGANEAFYAGPDGKLPYQLYHPRVNGKWPKHRVRLLWAWFFDWMDGTKKRRSRFKNPSDWEGQRLPGMVRNNHHTHMYTRWGVPVDKDLTRVVYFFTSRPRNVFGRLYDRLTFNIGLNWMIHFNFSDQDYDAMRSCRYELPEYLSSTDNPVIGLRKLVTEHARGIRRTVDVLEETSAERAAREADEVLRAAQTGHRANGS
ncbi:MAG: Rieske 2Fe-2S domain-containing protein [SAR202 cluster bacterium]|nr:Rieske 2Fe-2S domain-containing protein [SAR202 cluster bacterium]